MRCLSLPLLITLLASTATAQNYVETFDGDVNAGGWTFGNTIEGIDATGGNPGAFLHNTVIDTYAPQCRTTTANNPFHGDWRAMGVNSFGIDFNSIAVQFPYQREATLMLSNGSCTIYWLGTEFIPQVGTGWKSFDYAIDSASTSMPAGWLPYGSCTDPDTAWNTVMSNVTEVRIFYGDPTFFFIFDQWNVGMDNARLLTATGTPLCFGDGSGAACPCGNAGAGGEGCANSSGSGAVLTAGGGASVGSDGLHFSASQLPANKPSLLFAGDALLGNGAGQPFGDGLRCAGGSLRRLGVVFADGQGAASWGPGLAAAGNWSAGDTRIFQVWYRDDAGAACGNAFNVSSGVEVQFTN
ncbi:MAG: hypothetical protein ACI9F9_000110 [Candidatus Paceibacteria bacterium]|jgi:hypothetical protein